MTLLNVEAAIVESQWPRSPEDTAKGYELAYREGVRLLETLAGAHDAARTRAGIVVSAATIATSFLGGQALRESPSVWSWLAISTFVCVVAALLLVLLRGRDRPGYAADPALLIATYLEGDGAIATPLVFRDLALYFSEHSRTLRNDFRRLQRWQIRASVLLLVEIVLWIVDLAS